MVRMGIIPSAGTFADGSATGNSGAGLRGLRAGAWKRLSSWNGYIMQGLVNIPIFGDFEDHLKQYLLEIISPIFG